MEYALNRTDETLEAAVRAALPLTQAIAARFAGRGVELEDLKQVAALALVEALQRFEPDRGLRFTTFVTPTITGKVRNYIRDRAQLLRSPRGLREQGIKMDRANEQLTQSLRREPSVQELAEALGWNIQHWTCRPCATKPLCPPWTRRMRTACCSLTGWARMTAVLTPLNCGKIYARH